MKKILPIYNTPITSYPHTADIASILWKDKYIYPWLMNCFIKLYGWGTEHIDYEDFWMMDCPAILCERLNKGLIIKGWKNYIAFIIEALNFNYYVYLVANTKEINAYGKLWIPHDLFIYGYDDINCEFYFSDCLESGKYMSSSVSYAELEKALSYDEKKYTFKWMFHDDIILFKPNTNIKLSFYPDRVKTSLEEYLNSKPSYNIYGRLHFLRPNEEKRYTYGISCYKIIYQKIDESIANNIVTGRWKQIFHLLYEHKVVMYERISYMQKKYLNNANEYKAIYKKASDKLLICQNLYIKYSLKKDPCILYHILSIFKEIEQLEIECMTHMISDINC